MDTLPALLSPEVGADPESLYRGSGPRLRCISTSPINSYLVSRYDDIAACYRNPVLTTRCYEWQFEPVFGPTLVQMDGKPHARRRSMIMKYLRGPGLERWAPVVRNHTEKLLGPIVENVTRRLTQDWESGVEVDLAKSFSVYLPTYVILDILGLPESDQDRLYRWHRQITWPSWAPQRGIPRVTARGQQTRAESRAFLHDLVADRRRSPRGRYDTQALCEAQIDGDRIVRRGHRVVPEPADGGRRGDDGQTFVAMFGHLLADPKQFELVRGRPVVAAGSHRGNPAVLATHPDERPDRRGGHPNRRHRHTRRIDDHDGDGLGQPRRATVHEPGHLRPSPATTWSLTGHSPPRPRISHSGADAISAPEPRSPNWN